MTRDPNLLTRDEAAFESTKLGHRLTVAMLSQAAYRGTGPRFQHVNGRPHYLLADVLAWLDAPKPLRKGARCWHGEAPQHAAA